MADVKETCTFQGNADMYGMGIRIGYYLQWYGAIIASWIAPDEAQGLRIANSLFVTATFLALVILTVQGHKPEDMPVVETYIILFLTFGSYLVLVPIYVWRIFTGCNPLYDPSRFPRVNAGRVYSVCNTMLLLAVLVFQLWFWLHSVPKLNAHDCVQYGFFFWKFLLNAKSFMAVNIIPSVILLGICMSTVGTIAWQIARKQRSWRNYGKKYSRLQSVPGKRVYILQILDSISQTIVTTVIIAGVELTIIWNKIEGVHEISSAGQTIPLMIGIGSVGMVFYVRFFKREADEVFDDKPSGTPAQGYEMGSAHAYYAQAGQSAPETHVAPVQPTEWNSLPGGVRESR